MILKITALEIVEDLTPQSRCDEGFLKLRRLRLRNIHEDGSSSREYSCDIVSRPDPDAAVALLYRVDENGKIKVILKRGIRPPLYFRKDKTLSHPDEEKYLHVTETVAGILEKGEKDEVGLKRRACAEALEEAGYDIAPEKMRRLGGPSFASPGITDEKLYFFTADVAGLESGLIHGDGSPMEEGTELVILELEKAIALCREGKIPDMKTEIALCRLRDLLYGV